MTTGRDHDSPAVGPRAQTVLRIVGMDCGNEVDAVEDALQRIRGVLEVKVSLVSGTATVTHLAGLAAERLVEVVARTGLTASVAAKRGSERSFRGQRGQVGPVIMSGLFTSVGLALQWTGVGPQALSIGAFIGAIVAGGWLVVPKAVSSARRWKLDMNVLMSVAVVGAAAIGEWGEGAAVVFLFALSELLESFSVARARYAIQSLMELAPETAWIKDGDTFREVPVTHVKVGDHITVKSGARVPLDGTVVAGGSTVNQAPITGESMPVEKKADDTVFAGTINGEGSLEVSVTKAYSDTTLARIIHLVEEAQSQKAPSQRFVDVFAKYYTPAVMILALLVWTIAPLALGGAWAVWTYRALVLLVIACPCALVISTPVSVVSGLTALARRGVLIKGGAFLEAVGKLRALAVDKTGTITEGRPRVMQVIPFNSNGPEEIIRVAAAIDTHSSHPVAQATVAYARQQGVEFPRADNYQNRTGRGAEGELEGHRYFLGNHLFAHELAVCSDALEKQLEEIEAQAQSVVVVGHKPHAQCPGEVLGVLAVGDSIRSNAADAVRALHDAGVRRVVMLSGDNQRTVDAIATQSGIDEAHGDLLPDQKVAQVHALLAQHRYVGMIGDGINDAPAMAAATVGIAMGAAGTDTAIETADMALMQDNLVKVAEAVHLGRRTVRIIQANITFALAVKALFLVLAVSGHTSLWLAILADTGATLVVIANALRLLQPRACRCTR